MMTDSQPSPALILAGQHDQAGRHVESAEVLRTASLQGDLLAMSELGHRLLIGDRAPKTPKHALALLEGAANKGEGRALARIAALTGAGAYVKQDWPKALKLLGMAAEAGDESAQGQLQSLQPEHSTQGDWHRLAAQVPLEYWLSAAEGEILHEKVCRIPKLAPLSVCRWLISRSANRLGPALVYDSVSREVQRHEMRTNSMAMFDYSNFDVVQFLLQERMSRTCLYPIQHFEAPMVLHYAVGQQIKPHFDFIDANAADYELQIKEQGQRMVTFLLYLNEGYEGGETSFPKLEISNQGKAGSGLFFINANPDLSPDRRMLHIGAPPTVGEKWIVTQFIVSKRLRP